MISPSSVPVARDLTATTATGGNQPQNDHKGNGNSPGVPNRRTALRMLFVGITTAALVPFEWLYSKRTASAAGPTSEFTNAGCNPPYTSGYTEQTNSYGVPSGAQCFGGIRRSGLLCSSGRHREGVFTPVSGETFTSNRIDTSCGAPTPGYRNAWRWTSQGTVYRCSDATSTIRFYPGGGQLTGLTVGVCAI